MIGQDKPENIKKAEETLIEDIKNASSLESLSNIIRNYPYDLVSTNGKLILNKKQMADDINEIEKDPSVLIKYDISMVFPNMTRNYGIRDKLSELAKIENDKPKDELNVKVQEAPKAPIVESASSSIPPRSNRPLPTPPPNSLPSSRPRSSSSSSSSSSAGAQRGKQPSSPPKSVLRQYEQKQNTISEPSSNTEKLIQLITFRTENPAATKEAIIETQEKAKRIIDSMSCDELNQMSEKKETPLYCSVNNSRVIAEYILNKFLENKHPVNTTTPDGHSIFTHSGLAQRMLSLITQKYSSFACSDARTFQGNIHPKADSDKIIKKLSTMPDSNVRLGTQANMIQPIGGHYSRGAIKKSAELVDSSQIGSCTTFSLAVADKLLTLFPSERIQVVAHKAGHTGSHVYIIMNCEGDEWRFNSKAMEAAQTMASDEEAAEHLEKIAEAMAQQLGEAYIVDPWLASLGWSQGIFTPVKYMENHLGFLADLEFVYDSNLDKKENAVHREEEKTPVKSDIPDNRRGRAAAPLPPIPPNKPRI